MTRYTHLARYLDINRPPTCDTVTVMAGQRSLLLCALLGTVLGQEPRIVSSGANRCGDTEQCLQYLEYLQYLHQEAESAAGPGPEGLPAV